MLTEVTINHEHVHHLICNYRCTSTIHLCPERDCEGLPAGYVVVDMLGPDILKEVFKVAEKPIYLWFESIFAIPTELAGSLMCFYRSNYYGEEDV